MSKEKLHRGDIWKYYDDITGQERKFYILTVYEYHCDVIGENYFSSTEDDKYLKFPLWFDEFEGLNPTFVGKSSIDIEKIFNTKEHINEDLKEELKEQIKDDVVDNLLNQQMLATILLGWCRAEIQKYDTKSAKELLEKIEKFFNTTLGTNL